MPEPWNDLSLPDLYAHLAQSGLVRRLLELARDEDLGPDRVDLTGAACDSTDTAEARVVARQSGVVAGLAALEDLFRVFEAPIRADLAAHDGDRVEQGDTLATLTGPLADLVKAERTLLNLLGRLSGVATRTATFIDAMGDTAARLYDTRKTTPGLRVLEKYAVRCGGGLCHRLGLHDAVMFKDNHIAGVPTSQLASHVASLVACVETTSAADGRSPAFIEVEVDTLDQLDALLTLDPGVIDVILLDNMPPDRLADAVARRDKANPPLLLEASGGVTLETISAIARTGVDRVSVGSLTHQATSIDFGLDIK
ncbi:MAG: carboxylating nicotinate-nucleotide diphosphorylase [Phycisphaeraceae bacterium]|nr:MAG: carboxylating nicotinate-nucleotide diphosphorylase [Phycisphaeraceae bacterium]